MGKAFDVFKDNSSDRPLDIHEYMVKHPASTFFMTMDDSGPGDIKAGDVLVVDRSVTPKTTSVIVVATEGELKVEKFSKKEEEDKVLWGVVTGFLRKLR